MSSTSPLSQLYSKWQTGDATVEVVKGKCPNPAAWLSVADMFGREKDDVSPADDDLRHMVARVVDGGVILQAKIPERSYADLWTPVTVFIR